MLAETDGFLVSNSPMFVGPVQPARDEGELAVTYSLLLGNDGRSRFALLFDSASFTVKGRAGKADCRVSDVRLPRLRVFPGHRYRVDCKLTLGRELMDTLLQGDADGILKVPVLADESGWTLTFKYRFRVEDVS